MVRYIYVPIFHSVHTDGEFWCTETEMMSQQRHVDCFSRRLCPTVAELVPLLTTFIQYITYETSHLSEGYYK